MLRRPSSFMQGADEKAEMQSRKDEIGILSDRIGDAILNVDEFKIQVPETDDTARLNRAITKLKESGGGRLKFSKRTYKIKPIGAGGLQFYDMDNFIIDGDKTVIECDPVLVNASDQTSKRMLRFIGCKNFSVTGIHFKLRFDFNSTLVEGIQRFDQIIDIYSESETRTCENFEIHNNTFEYEGPHLHNPLNGEVSRLSLLLIDTATNISPKRLVKNFKIYGNTFKNGIGRTCYILLAENGSVFGNTWDELGKLVYPDGSRKQWAEAKGIRVLGSKNISVTGNTLNGYSGELINVDESNGAIDYIVVSKGTDLDNSENVTVTGNIINFNNTSGTALTLGAMDGVTAKGNVIKGNENSAYKTTGLKYSEGPSYNSVAQGNVFKHISILIDAVHTLEYKANIFDMNEHTRGVNHLTVFGNGADTKLIIGKNYYSDKGEYLCEGASRKRVLYAAGSPPSTIGNFTKGDTCINTSFNRDTSPVIEWVFTNDSGTAVWYPSKFQPIKTSSLPTLPTGSQSTGVTALYTGNVVNGELCIHNGTRWVKYDGTAMS